MAKEAAKGVMTGQPRTNVTMKRLQRFSVVASVAAAIHEAGLKNVLASTMMTAAAPMTATAFVYQVQSMRTAELNRLALDRAQYAASDATRPERYHGDIDRTTAATPPPKPDMIRKLDAMLDSRSSIIDTFGDDPSTVAPIYARMIKQMLKDDEAAFAAMSDARSGTSPDDAAKLSEKEAELRLVHTKLTKLAGAA